MNFLSLVEIDNIFLIQALFLLNFTLVLFLSYPLGSVILSSIKERNIFVCSIISISLIGIFIGILLNFFALLGKYLIIIFFFFNLALFGVNKNLIKNFFNEIYEKVHSSIFITYFIITNLIYSIKISNNSITIPYTRHLIYFSPIQEIFNADYFLN